MANAINSTRKFKRTVTKKPYADFPLTVHRNGQWCKKFQGKQYYFGLLDDWNAALERFKREWPDIIQGKPVTRGDHNTQDGELTLRELCNNFLNAKRRKVDAGELSPRSLEDYIKTCDRLISHFTKSCRIDQLRPSDFDSAKQRINTPSID